jgi:2-polyprenyl-3-methyl-5-hydroxy-6-metoxy-1,4-benzoquinol methylase
MPDASLRRVDALAPASMFEGPGLGAAPVTLGGSSCPVCGDVAHPSIDVGEFSLYSCARCDSWCSDALHRRAASSFEHTRYHENDEADDDKRLALLQRLEQERRPLRAALDIGCGTGAFLAYLGRQRPDVLRVGVELDLERAAQARAANPGARILTGDALESLAAIDERFDLITLWDVYEHVPEPGPLLGILAEKLSPEGCIYIQTIHENSAVPFLGRLSYHLTGGWLRGPVRRTHDPDHLVFFSRKGLDMLSRKAGLAIREQWFDRLAWARMDGNFVVRAATSLLLTVENAIGNGLFVNLILERRGDAPAA